MVAYLIDTMGYLVSSTLFRRLFFLFLLSV